MIIIKNSQRKIKIDTNKTEKIIKKILEIIDYKDFDVSIWFTTNETIRKYNREFRKKDKATDILSFPFYPQLKPGQRIKITEKVNSKIIAKDSQEVLDAKNLGDIIISLGYAYKYAMQNGINFDQHLKVLLVHGICHLIGYDHITEKDYKLMNKKELEILSKV